MKKANAKTSTRSTKSTTTRKPAASKTAKVSLHRPGDLPVDVPIKTGETVGQFVSERNLGGFDVFVNGNSVSSSTVLQKGDTIRVGVKTKNG